MKKYFTIFLVFVAAAVIWFCYSHFFNVLWNFKIYPYRSIPQEIERIDFKKSFHVQSEDELSELRNKLQSFVWGGPLNKSILPEEVPVEDSAHCYTMWGSINLEASKEFLIHQDYGIDSKAALFQSVQKIHPKTLVIYHHGHTDDYCKSQNLIKTLVQENIDVVALNMILRGNNPQPIVSLGHFSRVPLVQHEYLKFSQPQQGHALQYFLNPVLAMVNWAQLKGQYERIVMVGLSGGGWTTTVYSALDERISQSIEIAGSYPMVLRFLAQRDWGDWEQNIPDFYNQADYMDLYVLSAWKRQFTQIFNQYDDCCFAGRLSQAYAPVVHLKMEELKIDGDYQAIVDSSLVRHAISQETIKNIVLKLNKNYPSQ